MSCRNSEIPMSLEDMIAFLNEGKTCVACGKGLKGGEATGGVARRRKQSAHLLSSVPGGRPGGPKRYLERVAQQTFLCELVRPRDARSPPADARKSFPRDFPFPRRKQKWGGPSGAHRNNLGN